MSFIFKRRRRPKTSISSGQETYQPPMGLDFRTPGCLCCSQYAKPSAFEYIGESSFAFYLTNNFWAMAWATFVWLSQNFFLYNIAVSTGENAKNTVYVTYAPACVNIKDDTKDKTAKCIDNPNISGQSMFMLLGVFIIYFLPDVVRGCNVLWLGVKGGGMRVLVIGLMMVELYAFTVVTTAMFVMAVSGGGSQDLDLVLETFAILFISMASEPAFGIMKVSFYNWTAIIFAGIPGYKDQLPMPDNAPDVSEMATTKTFGDDEAGA